MKINKFLNDLIQDALSVNLKHCGNPNEIIMNLKDFKVYLINEKKMSSEEADEYIRNLPREQE